MVVARDKSGKPIRMTGTHLDITDQKKAEEKLIESEKRFRILSEASFDGILLAKDGMMLEANEQFLKLFGYTRDEVVGKSGFDIIYPEDKSLVMKNVRTQYTKPYEARFVRKDGSVFYAEVCGQTILYNGEISRIIVEKRSDTSCKYVQVWILNTQKPVYRFKDTGAKLNPYEVEKLKSFLQKSSSNKERQGLAKEIFIRDYAIANIKQINMRKLNYHIK